MKSTSISIVELVIRNVSIVTLTVMLNVFAATVRRTCVVSWQLASQQQC